MCIVCASIPATAALGAKLNVSQLKKPQENRLPIAKITGGIIALLLTTSIIYHTFFWRNW